jgi:dodecin
MSWSPVDFALLTAAAVALTGVDVPVAAAPVRAIHLVTITVSRLRAQGTRRTQRLEGTIMSVARITEISAKSTESFEAAIHEGIARATQTLRNVQTAWIKEQQINVENDRVASYQVNMLITFVLE